MNRRHFLAASLAVAGSATVRGADEGEVFPIIDTHEHLWDLGKFRLPWLKGESSLARNYLPADYRKATADLGSFPAAGRPGAVPVRVVKTVYMEVDVEPSQHVAEAEYVIGLCCRADNPMVAAVIGGRPASDDFPKYVDRFKGSACVKGIRQVLHGPGTPAGYCLEKKFVHGIRLLGDSNLSFDLCMRPAELLDAAKLIDACPDTRFILDHCGNADVQARDREQWRKDMAAVAKRKNVVCKVSGIVASARPGKWTAEDLAPIIEHTLAVFGPDRVMFGGDWPVCTKAATFRQWVDALRSVVAGRGAAEQRKLFHDNALVFYRLK
jgi:L-fuconolactonase